MCWYIWLVIACRSGSLQIYSFRIVFSDGLDDDCSDMREFGTSLNTIFHSIFNTLILYYINITNFKDFYLVWPPFVHAISATFDKMSVKRFCESLNLYFFDERIRNNCALHYKTQLYDNIEVIRTNRRTPSPVNHPQITHDTTIYNT